MLTNRTQKVTPINSRKHPQKTHAKREDRQSLVYSRLLRHPARKRSRSNLLTQEPAQGRRIISVKAHGRWLDSKLLLHRGNDNDF